VNKPLAPASGVLTFWQAHIGLVQPSGSYVN
jgi:hypothetical protein